MKSLEKNIIALLVLFPDDIFPQIEELDYFTPTCTQKITDLKAHYDKYHTLSLPSLKEAGHNVDFYINCMEYNTQAGYGISSLEVKSLLQQLRDTKERELKTETAQRLILKLQQEEDITEELDILNKQEPTEEHFDLKKEVFAVMDYIFENESKPSEFYTGLADLDRATSGFIRSEMTIIAGETSVGKSALCGTLALHITQKNKKVLWLTGEMSIPITIKRLIQMHSGINLSPGHDKHLSDEAKGRIADTSNQIPKLPLILISGELTTAIIENNIITYQPDIVFVDYIQLIKGGKGDNRNQELGEISRALKGFAIKYNIPLIVFSQPSEVNTLRDSGEIKQNADNIWWLVIPKGTDIYKDKLPVIDLEIRKHRNGAPGKIKLVFSRQVMRFIGIEHRENE